MARKYRDKSLHDNILAKKIAVGSSQRRFFIADLAAQIELLPYVQDKKR